MILVLDDGGEIPVWYLDAGWRADLGVIDGLARLQLGARRLGHRIRLDNPCADLSQLLHFFGLAEALGLELGGEPEGLEELGVEEVVQPGDPAV